MKPERGYQDYLQDMLDAIEKIERFTEGMSSTQAISDEKRFSR